PAGTSSMRRPPELVSAKSALSDPPAPERSASATRLPSEPSLPDLRNSTSVSPTGASRRVFTCLSYFATRAETAPSGWTLCPRQGTYVRDEEHDGGAARPQGVRFLGRERSPGQEVEVCDDGGVRRGVRLDGGEADDADLHAAYREEDARARPGRALAGAFLEYVGGEERIGGLCEALAERGEAEIELVVADRGGGHADAVEDLDHRAALELVGDERSLELVSAVDHDGFAAVPSRLRADGSYPSGEPVHPSHRLYGEAGERLVGGRLQECAMDVVDANHRQLLDARGFFRRCFRGAQQDGREEDA